MFPTLFISSLWLIYFVTDSFDLLISLTYFIHPPNPLPSDNYLFILYMYGCFCLIVFIHMHAVHMKYFHIK